MKLVSMKAGLAALALAGAAAVPAFAQVASATVNYSHYELVDLDLSDGVTPWLQFTAPQALTSIAAILPGSSSNGLPLAESRSWSGELAAVQSGLYEAQAQGSVTGVFSWASGSPNLVWSSALTRYGFLLSPNTSVTFYFSTDLDTTADGGAAMAVAGMQVRFGSEAFPVTELVARDGEHFSGSSTAFADAYGTEAVQGEFWMTTITETRAAAMPVPEPATPTMLLGGLGLLAAAGWRRTR
jgi:hypothetical protein